MLPKLNRLPPSDIRRVMRTGQRVNSGSIQLLYTPTTKESARRFAVVVPKTVDKRATTRNYLKRLVREALRSELPNVSPSDSVIRVKRSLPGTTFIIIKRLLHEMLERATLLPLKQ